MKKKILIGSIIAVLILTLVSFTSVVGYNHVKSDTKISSPLFRIRNNEGYASSNYIGKESKINIFFPIRNKTRILTQQFIDRINKMKNEELEYFIQFIISKTSEDKITITEENIRDVLNSLKNTNLENINDYSLYLGNYNKENEITSSPYITLCHPQQFCILTITIVIILLILLDIYDWLAEHLSWGIACHTACCQTTF